MFSAKTYGFRHVVTSWRILSSREKIRQHGFKEKITLFSIIKLLSIDKYLLLFL